MAEFPCQRGITERREEGREGQMVDDNKPCLRAELVRKWKTEGRERKKVTAMTVCCPGPESNNSH